MGLLQNLVKGFSGDKKEFKEKLKDAEMNFKIQKSLEEKQKSSNRRELERIMRDREEDNIKEALKKIRKQENKENWKSKHSILAGGTSMLKSDKPILKQRNIFKHGSQRSPMKQGGMFFK